MHDQPIQDRPDSGSYRSNAAEDRRDQGVVLVHVITTYPRSLRLSDLVRELTADPGDFAERDGVERGVRDLVSAGLLFRSGGVVLPTRAALCFNEVTDLQS
jgi:hypothetical protein